MYLVNRKLLLLLLFLAVCAPVLLGVRALLLAGDFAGLGPEELKLWAENSFFLSLLGGVLVIVVGALILRRSRNVLRELDKARDLARYASFSSSGSLRRLGGLGEKIRLLYLQLTELNDKKSLKISTLAGVIDFFLQAGDLPLVIADVTGKITQVSRKYLEAYKLDQLDLAGKYLSEIIPDLVWQELVARLEKEHRALKSGAAKESPVFYPVFNRGGELAAVICVRGRDSILGELARLGDETSRTVDRVRRFFRKQISPGASPAKPSGGSTDGKSQERRNP
jgi:PAS domain-containing protein